MKIADARRKEVHQFSETILAAKQNMIQSFAIRTRVINAASTLVHSLQVSVHHGGLRGALLRRARGTHVREPVQRTRRMLLRFLPVSRRVVRP